MTTSHLIAGTIAGFFLAVVSSTPGRALDATLHRITDELDRDNGWSVGATCNILYANYCNGYVYVLDEPEFRSDSLWVGQHYQQTDCCGADNSSVLVSTTTYAWSGAPFGYGFTSTIAIYAASAGTKCPTGSPLASQPWAAPRRGPNRWYWGIPCTKSFVQLVNTGPKGDHFSFVVDAPSMGQGPGNLHPCQSPNPTNSFFYGSGDSPLCPGSEMTALFAPNSAPVSLFRWSAQKVCSPVSVEESTLGQIKALYR